MIAALYLQTNLIIMKKLLLMAVLAGFTFSGAVAQGKSTYGHSHKKAKTHYKISNSTATDRNAINSAHRTTIKAVTSNDALSNQQQKTRIKQANATHKIEMKAVTKGKK